MNAMYQHHHHHQMAEHNHSNFLTVIIGFIFAVSNQIFGWMNTLLEVQHSGILMQCLQAIITGGLGALSAYLVNKSLKMFEKYIKRKK